MNCFDGTFSIGKAFALAGGVGKAVRNVLNLNGVSQYAVAPRVEEIDLDYLNLEFEIEFTGNWKDGRTILTTGDPKTLQDFLYTNELRFARLYNRLHISLGGAAAWGSETGVFPDDDNIHNYVIKVKREDGATNALITIEVDNKVVSQDYPKSVDGFRNPQESLYIGAFVRADSGALSKLYKGQLSDIKIWTGGDRVTGTLTRYYKMDEGWRGANNQVLVNYATELGEELSTLVTPFDTPVIGSQQYAASYAINSRENLPQYANLLLRYTAINYIGTSDVGFSSQGGIPSSFRRKRDYDFYGVAEYDSSAHSSTIAVFAFPNVDSQCTFTNVSVRQAAGYGTYVGLTEASWTEEEV